MDKVKIKNIDILTAQNQAELLNFLVTKETVRSGKLVAINAEKVIMCDERSEVNELIRHAEYKYADGISVVYAIRKKYPQYKALERIAGADLWLALMQRAAEFEIPVFLVGGQADILIQTFEKLQKIGVNIVGMQDGYFSTEQENGIFEQIKLSNAKIVTVALGSPKQEIFMRDAQKYYLDALYMGVGGTYDVFTGKVKRAPQCWQNLGLEWLYRLLKQPTRWQRQVRLLKFAYYYWCGKL